MKTISVIVPCFNEQEALPYFWKEICPIAQRMQEEKGVQFEFLFVDDGSKDDTLLFLRQLAQEDKRVRYLSFSRNFGKEAAMYAGFQHATGDYVAVMDVDLQDPPSLLPAMYEIWRAGNTTVWPPDGSPARANRRCAVFLPAAFIS